MAKKWIYSFDEGSAKLKDLLGGKGANLAEMTNLGFPVPAGFTLTTEACLNYYENNKSLSEKMIIQVKEHLNLLENKTGKKFGDINNPLLVSIRSGASISMPGMMDTILNLGLNDETVASLAEITQDARFAYDNYRRFIQMFSDVACDTPKHLFERVLDRVKNNYKIDEDQDLTKDHLIEIIAEFKRIHKRNTGVDFPQDPYDQLFLAISAVFNSWNTNRAITYRKIHSISNSMGTAVNVQAMVFGNMGNDSGTGVAFTRNPATGENKLYGEFLINAQGEDVVAGIRTPLNITELADLMPEIYQQFAEIAKKLELHYNDMQDIEFTIEKNKLYILQTRTGKRTAQAALRIATELVEENLISKEEAVLRIDPASLDQLLHPTFDMNVLAQHEPLAQGLPASPGAATGKIYFTAEDALVASQKHQSVILVRQETSPEDIEGMHVANGILTSRGGMTSHAAVVARGMGKCCVAGCETLNINEERKTITVRDQILREGDYISLDGSSGKVYKGIIETVNPKFSDHFEKFMQYARQIKKIGVRANADNEADALIAMGFGIEGIGLCRTEHMFFKENRVFAVRQMILAETLEQREKALNLLLPMQKKDFKEIFQVVKELPVTIRLLDPPLHEFLPTAKKDIEALAKQLNNTYEHVSDIINYLSEVNPMLGHRGCRLAITYPEIAIMQTRAIIEAAIEVSQEENIKITPEIMVPLVGIKGEFDFVKEVIQKTTEDVMKQYDFKLDYHIGTMIEVPRAVLIADEIAESSAFFSFGTNDLTQMGFGFSRDDAGKYINEYQERGILEADPFQTIDIHGIGKLVEMGVKLGRSTNPDLQIGVCGEHAGDAKSIKFFYEQGLDYVSCSPYRVPIATLAAARASIKK